MVKTLVRNEDFKVSSVPQQVQGVFYYGEGFPIGQIQSPNPGAIYVDSLSGQLWLSVMTGISDNTAWRPFSGSLINNIRIAEDVQNGDFIGIYGTGTWASSGSLLIAKFGMASGGSQSAAFVAGGSTDGALTNATELFNGSAWYASGILAAANAESGGAGSQNAGIVAGGFGTGAVVFNTTQLFDGSTWSTSAGVLSISKYVSVALGTSSATLLTGGFVAAAASNTELFNGSTWSSGSALSIAKYSSAGAGSQNAGMITGGFTSAVTNATELFNGSAWSMSAVISAAKYRAGGAGSQNSALIAGGTTSGKTNVSELFNGSVWSASGNIATARELASGAGSQKLGMIAGGQTATSSNGTELHSQSIYRKLNFSNVASANNIGMAYNASVSSLTASLMLGDVPSDVVPQQSFFGISRLNTTQTNVRISSITATITSISASDSFDVNNNQAILNLSTTFTNAFWNGMGILVNGTTVYPVVYDPDSGIQGTAGAPLVRWENVSSSASTSLTATPVSLQRFTHLTAQSITLSAGMLNVNLTNVGNLTITTFARWVGVGNVISIPYSTVSNTLGSAYNYGAYIITSVSNNGTLFTVSVTSQNSQAATEVPSTGIGNITIFQQFESNKVCLSVGDIKLGFRNKMHYDYVPFWDDFSNGLI